MKPITVVDFTELHAPLSEAIQAGISEVIQSGQFIGGPVLEEFNAQLTHFLGAPSCGVGNGTDALQIALRALGVGEGDEVLVPSFSYFASAEAISAVGATPVFVDVDPRYFSMDLQDAESKITDRTRAIIWVHLFGCINPAIIDAVNWCNSHKLGLVEDCAQAIGAFVTSHGEKLMAGTIGDIGTYSFFPTKNLGAFGDGGALVSCNSELLEHARMIAQHGQKEKYEHQYIGMNSRLDAIQAKVLGLKLPHLDSWNAKRVQVAQWYHQHLSDISELTLPVLLTNGSHVYHQFTVLTSNRDALLAHLSKAEIPVRLYYPKAIHQQVPYQGFVVDLPVTLDIQSHMISLPIHPGITQVQVQYIAQEIRTFFS